MLKMVLSFLLLLLMSVFSIELRAQSRVIISEKKIMTDPESIANKYREILQLSDLQRNRVFKYLLNAEQEKTSPSTGTQLSAAEKYWKRKNATDSFYKTVFTERQYTKYENIQRVDAVDND